MFPEYILQFLLFSRFFLVPDLNPSQDNFNIPERWKWSKEHYIYESMNWPIQLRKETSVYYRLIKTLNSTDLSYKTSFIEGRPPQEKQMSGSMLRWISESACEQRRCGFSQGLLTNPCCCLNLNNEEISRHLWFFKAKCPWFSRISMTWNLTI